MTRMISFWKYFYDSSSPIIQENCKNVKSFTQETLLLIIHGLIKNFRSSGETNVFSATAVERKSAFSRIVENQWYSNRAKYS